MCADDSRENVEMNTSLHSGQLSSPNGKQQKGTVASSHCAQTSECEMGSEDVLKCCIVFKMIKQNFTMTFTSPVPQQRENLNSLMLYLKGLALKWASQPLKYD